MSVLICQQITLKRSIPRNYSMQYYVYWELHLHAAKFSLIPQMLPFGVTFFICKKIANWTPISNTEFQNMHKTQI